MDRDLRNKLPAALRELAPLLVLTVLCTCLLLAGELRANWHGFLEFTGMFFGMAIWETKEKWRYRRYWLVLLGCLITHCGLVVALRTYLAVLRFAGLGVLSAAECAGLVVILLSVRA